jgi:hypothetical protein
MIGAKHGEAMKAPRLFIAHETLESWTTSGRAELHADDLFDIETQRRFKLCEGVRFLEEVTGAVDTLDLVGKVKDAEQLAQLGGEHMADSVLIGELAYRVQPGMVGSIVLEEITTVPTPTFGAPRAMPPLGAPKGLRMPRSPIAAPVSSPRNPAPVAPSASTVQGAAKAPVPARVSAPTPAPVEAPVAAAPVADAPSSPEALAQPSQSQTIAALQKFFLNNVK